MKTIISAMTLIGLVAAGVAQAGTITFSGRNWTTYDSFFTDQYSPGQWNDYTATANSGTMTARFGSGDTYMTTALSLNVGDTVSYDYFLTEESRNLRGTGASTYVGDSRTGFQDLSGNWVTARIATYSGRWTQYWEGGDPGDSITYARGNPWTMHVAWVFDSATSATVTLTLDNETTPFATWTDTFSNIADISQFRVGLWDSEQDVVLSNFAVTAVPEPSSASLMIGGLALLGLRTWSRRKM